MSFPVLTPDELRRCVKRLPRVDLAHLLTPLEEIPRFAERDRRRPAAFITAATTAQACFLEATRRATTSFFSPMPYVRACDVVVWDARAFNRTTAGRRAVAGAKLGLVPLPVLGLAPPIMTTSRASSFLDHPMGARVEIIDVAMGLGSPDDYLLGSAPRRPAGRRTQALMSGIESKGG